MIFPRQSKGFTLLELLVAIAVFGVVMAIAYEGLSSAARSNAEFEQRVERLGSIQLTAAILERDFSQAIARTMRDGYGDQRAALVGSASTLELTRLGVASGPFPERPLIERVAWELDGNKLTRLIWPVLDRAPGTAPVIQEVLQEVNSIRLEYFLSGAGWRTDWPPDRAPKNVLPRAIRIVLDIEGFGELERVMEIAVGLNAVPQS